MLRSGTPWELLPRRWAAVRDDLLAASAGLAEGRSVGPPAARAARPARSPERDRLQSSVPRQRLDRRQKGAQRRARTRPIGQAGHEAPRRHRCEGHPPRPEADGANVHDSRMLEAVVDAVPPIRSCWGPPRKRPLRLHADKAYDHRRCPSGADPAAASQPRIGPARIESSQRLGRRSGSSSARWRGSPSSVASPSATSGEPTSISPSPRWPQPSSSGASSNDGLLGALRWREPDHSI